MITLNKAHTHAHPLSHTHTHTTTDIYLETLNIGKGQISMSPVGY